MSTWIYRCTTCGWARAVDMATCFDDDDGADRSAVVITAHTQSPAARKHQVEWPAAGVVARPITAEELEIGRAYLRGRKAGAASVRRDLLKALGLEPPP